MSIFRSFRHLQGNWRTNVPEGQRTCARSVREWHCPFLYQKFVYKSSDFTAFFIIKVNFEGLFLIIRIYRLNTLTSILKITCIFMFFSSANPGPESSSVQCSPVCIYLYIPLRVCISQGVPKIQHHHTSIPHYFFIIPNLQFQNGT